MRTLSNAGVHIDFPIYDYMADPCPEPSLSQSLAKVLLDECPLKAWFRHPRLNPHVEPEDEKKFDLGNVAHKLMLKRGRDIAVIDAPDWRTKLAQAERQAALQDGKLAILVHHLEQARQMKEAAGAQLDGLGIINAFSQGSGEVVCTAFDGNTGDGVWLRTMVDWMVSTVECWDYKTTGMSVAEHVLPRYAEAHGFDVQAAMQERILDILFPEEAGRRKFRFVCQETDPPYLLNVIEMTEHWMEMGRRKVQRAVDIWADCLRADNWPAYATRILQPEYPSYAENRWLEREIADAAKERRPEFNPNILMAG